MHRDGKARHDVPKTANDAQGRIADTLCRKMRAMNRDGKADTLCQGTACDAQGRIQEHNILHPPSLRRMRNILAMINNANKHIKQ